MKFDAFNVLVDKLTPILKSKCLNLVRPQLEVREIIAIVLYRFARGLNLKHMLDRFDVGAPTVCKYVDIVCDVFCNKDIFLTSTSRFQSETICCTSYNNLTTL
jgi:hypothetical protein